MTNPFSWDDFETELLAEIRFALTGLRESHPAERFFAVALYGVYRELDGLLSLPMLAAASLADRALPDAGGFWSARFNPPDWKLAEIELRQEPAERLESALTAEAKRGSQEHWRKVESRYLELLLRLACRLRDDAPALLSVTDDFIAYWHDEQGGPNLAAKSIPAPLFEKLFARQVEETRERQAVAKMPVAERAVFLVSRFGCFEGVNSEYAQQALLALGPDAVPALIAGLSHPKNGWTAAKVLGQIGMATPEITLALRARAGEHWFARALGMLGDHAWLAQQGGEAAVHGLCARLKAISSSGVRWPLDYRPLEVYLDTADAEVVASVEEELEPGSSYVGIAKDDIDEAVRGLQNRHAVIRWHAACLLGERGLGEDVGKRVLPLLAERLADPHPIVRRLAVLAISDWKQAGRPYYGDIQRLSEDPDEIVRRMVKHVLST